MLAELAVIVVVLAMVIYVYLKSTLIKSFVMLIGALIASTVAMSYFETLSGLIMGYGFGGVWVVGGAFLLIFILVFAILNAIGDQLVPPDLYFGDFPDRAIRSLLGAVAGFTVAGVILITAALLPIGTKWPYQRFSDESISTKPTEPDKSLFFNADGFVAGFASLVSKGSMASTKSLALFHPDFVNEIHLCRIGKDASNLPVAGKTAISVKAAWDANSELLSAMKQPIQPASGTRFVIVRAEIDGRMIKEGGALSEDGKVVFTLVQFRLICKDKDSANDLRGKGGLVYPRGIMQNAITLNDKKNLEEITIQRSDFDGGSKQIDLVFEVPTGKVPVILEFKQNTAAQVKLVTAENVPAPLPEAKTETKTE